MPVIALCIEYDGSFFQGFQRQKDHPTVQQALEDAFYVAYKEKIHISAAGRTDTGVHARGMIVSFRTQIPISNYHRMISALNAISKRGVSVLAAREMPENFHARFSCSEREYEYLVLHSKYKHPLWENRAYRIHEPINLDKIRPQLKFILGQHEFRSFAKTISVKGKSTQRQITFLDIVESQEFSNLYFFRVRGTGFLHNMVRILVGTILDIATGKLNKSLLEVLISQDRKLAGTTLPPEGLYFKKAYYKDFPEIEELYKNQVY